jgi:hypothetical protein
VAWLKPERFASLRMPDERGAHRARAQAAPLLPFDLDALGPAVLLNLRSVTGLEYVCQLRPKPSPKLRMYIHLRAAKRSRISGTIRASTLRQSAIGVSPPSLGCCWQKKKILRGHSCR